MFLKDHWYVAAWSRDLSREFLAITLLSESVVLYRREDGQPAALANRCPHRNLPLSKGRLIGDTVQCGYHGLEFGPDGVCVKAPGQATIPAWCQVRSYPVEERHGWVFVWMGDPAKANVADLPHFHADLASEQWGAATGQLNVQCGYRLILDNLLDLSHLAYVHSSTTGNPDVAQAAAVEVTAENENHVRQTRLMHDVGAAPAFAYYAGYNGNIDRWQVTNYYAPSYISINNGSRAAGNPTDRIDCPTDLGDWGFRVFHAITPETQTSCHQFWAVPFRKDMVGEQDYELWNEQMTQVLIEDHDIYVAQQASISADPLAKDHDVRPAGALEGDKGLQRMRMVLRQLHREEAKSH